MISSPLFKVCKDINCGNPTPSSSFQINSWVWSTELLVDRNSNQWTHSEVIVSCERFYNLHHIDNILTKPDDISFVVQSVVVWLCVCVCVCGCVWESGCGCVCVYVCVCEWLCVCVWLCVYECGCVCMSVVVCVCMWVVVCVYMCVYVCVYGVCVCVWLCVCISIFCTCWYACMAAVTFSIEVVGLCGCWDSSLHSCLSSGT